MALNRRGVQNILNQQRAIIALLATRFAHATGFIFEISAAWFSAFSDDSKTYKSHLYRIKRREITNAIYSGAG